MPKTLATPALPPLLAPYIISSLKGPGTRHNSLTLVTYTLTASPFWLLLQYLSVGLLGAGADQETTSQRHADGFGGGVVLASFVREWEAWREGARRAVGYTFYLLYVLERPFLKYGGRLLLDGCEGYERTCIGTAYSDHHDTVLRSGRIVQKISVFQAALYGLT